MSKPTYCNYIEETNDDSEDTRRHQESPEWQSQRFLACSFFVHVSQHVKTQDHHGAPQRYKPMSRTKERPVASEEITEKRTLRDDQEQANDGCDDMACRIEKEELIRVRHTSLHPDTTRTLEIMKVFTSMTMLLATTEASAIILRPR